ncbi:putative anti-sigma factor antagonist BtrV [Candidatus Competibacter denitrificans Run_A_D11]|uniref:Anti-sigma factor antagonist n=1 Tax=Candidatus Competibacter denitrificans Run_A_D11 TaxID=1400863 RepID=W6M741_9GAMM|nr:STAS domain-containing protein [Candidatus Competibacter denitrificans]CDI03502.1 putative anti-sigma factor antagonist BtrV [Candidatus Competibacter denitrificans Run_A_D11]
MDILEESRDGIVVVAPRGRIDCNTSAHLERKLLALLEPASRGLVIDFTGVDYISSAGLRVMLVLAKRLRGGRGALVLCQLNDLIQDVFKMSGFNKVMAIVATRAEALAKLP